MSFTKDELEKLRQELPRGSARKIANKLNLSEGTVKNALGGHSNNEQVVMEAIEIVKAFRASTELAKNQISAL